MNYLPEFSCCGHHDRAHLGLGAHRRAGGSMLLLLLPACLHPGLQACLKLGLCLHACMC